MGGPVNHLLSDGGMSTMIGGAKGVDHGLVGGGRGRLEVWLEVWGGGG